MSARVDQVTTGQYHQVLALTQYMINTGLSNLFEIQRFNDPEKWAPAEFQALGQGFSDLTLGPPQIIIETLDDNHTNIFYQIHLKTGTFKTIVDKPKDRKQTDEDIASLEYAVNDWYFTFAVDLAQIVLQDDDPRKGDALKKLKRQQGKYTVQQLMVNMKTAKITNPIPAQTSFGVWAKGDYNLNKSKNPINKDKIQIGQPRDWDKEPLQVKTMFNFLITQICDFLVEADLQNLGITVEAAEAGRLLATDPGHPPTFMPVDCRFQTYPWKEPGNPNYKEVNGIDGNGRLNYLLYLEMTGNYDGTTPTIPQGDARFLREVGNWTDGTKPGVEPRSHFGTFILAESKFIDEFLLPKFDKMNRMVKIDLSDLKAEVHTSGLKATFNRDIKLKIGEGVRSGYDACDDPYRFKKDDPSAGLIQMYAAIGLGFHTKLPSNAITWYWSFFDDKLTQKNTDRYINIGYKAEHSGEAQSATLNRLSIVPGSNEIKFEGFSLTRLAWIKDWDIVPNIKSELICSAIWSLTMTMTEVSDGGIQFLIETMDPKVTFQGENKDHLQWYQDYMQSAYNEAGKNFTMITKSLSNSLEGQERFFLPASGIFYFKNPMFNHKGALLAGLEYNGNAEIEIPNPDAAARTEAPAVGSLQMPSGGNQPQTEEENKKP